MTNQETVPLDLIKQNTRLAKLLTTGLISGIIAAILNIIYMNIHETVTSFSIPEVVNLGSISLASIIPGIFSGLYYFMLRRVSSYKTAFGIFVSTTIVLLGFSLIGPLSTELPDGSLTPYGFVGLTIPMHFICAIIYISMVTRVVPRS